MDAKLRSTDDGRTAPHEASARRRAVRSAARSQRMFDVVASTVALLGLAPLLVGLALWIYAHDRGPVLARRTCVGRRGRPFAGLVFRTTVRAAEQEVVGRHLSEPAPGLTGPGRVMLRSSLHELPRLINVLRGEMSLVGPRPVAWDTPRADDGRAHKLAVRPGLVGPEPDDALPEHEGPGWGADSLHDWSMGKDLAVLLRSARTVAGSR